MKLLCAACGEAGPLRLVAEGDSAVQVTCQHCGATCDVALVPAAPGGADPAERCPKCDAAVGDKAACPGCGLARENRERYLAARQDSGSPSLEAAWRAVEEDFADQARHDALVQAAAAAGAFAWAAGKYQEVCRRRPDDALARRQLSRVRRTAEAAMLASAQVRQVQRPPYRSATAVLLLLVIAVGAGVAASSLLRGRGGEAPSRPARPASGALNR